MAVKFSQFVVETDIANVNYLVGWDGADNVQITPADLLSGFNIGSTNDVAYFGSSNSVIGDSTTPFVYQPTGGGGQPAGRLGLGTSSPNFKMDISGGDLRFENNDGIRFGGTGSNNTYWRMFTTGTSTGNLSIGNSASTPYLTISRGSSTTGFVGIGTSSPGALLQVDGTFISSGLSQLGSGGSDVLLTSSGAGNVGIGDSSPTAKLVVNNVNTKMLELKRSGNIKLRVLADANHAQLDMFNSSSTKNISLHTSGDSYFNGGNVGIGTTSPSYPFDVFNTDAPSDIIARFKTNDNSTYIQLVSAGSSWQIGATSDSLDWYNDNNSTVRMSLTETGNLGIGTTSPESKLTIKGDPGNTNQPVRITNVTTDAKTGLFINGTGNAVNEKYGMQFGGYNEYSIGGIFGVLDSTGGSTSGDITFDFGNGRS